MCDLVEGDRSALAWPYGACREFALTRTLRVVRDPLDDAGVPKDHGHHVGGTSIQAPLQVGIESPGLAIHIVAATSADPAPLTRDERHDPFDAIPVDPCPRSIGPEQQDDALAVDPMKLKRVPMADRSEDRGSPEIRSNGLLDRPHNWSPAGRRDLDRHPRVWAPIAAVRPLDLSALELATVDAAPVGAPARRKCLETCAPMTRAFPATRRK